MPIYISKEATLEEIVFYARKKHGYINGNVSSVDEVKKLLTNPSFSYKDGELIPQERVFVGHVSTIDKLNMTSFDSTNIYLKVEDINSVGQVVPASHVFKPYLEKVSFIFTHEGFQYFWDKFGRHPLKASFELTHIIDLFKDRKEKIGIHTLKSMYEGKAVQHYLSFFGTHKGSKILSTLDKGELWRLFIGNEKVKPLLYSFLLRRAPILWSFIDENMESTEDALAVDLLVRATFSIDKKDINNWKVTRNGE